MDEEKKTSKVVRYKLQTHFLKQHLGQNFQIVYPPGMASCCFLLYILSTVPMAIAPYSEREAGVCVGRGEQCFSVWFVLLLCQVHYLHFIWVLTDQAGSPQSRFQKALLKCAWRYLIAFGGRHLSSLQSSGILCFPRFLAVSNQDPRSRAG